MYQASHQDASTTGQINAKVNELEQVDYLSSVTSLNEVMNISTRCEIEYSIISHSLINRNEYKQNRESPDNQLHSSRMYEHVT